MTHPGYLHHWIQKYFKRVWPARTVPPRVMGARAVLAAQQDNFLKFGEALVSRFGDTFPEERRLPIEFAILDLEDEGAWVIWPAQCYGVLMTKGLLWKIQRISWEAQELLPVGFDAPVKKSNFLKQLWADLPQNEAHFYHFGSLIGHIAFSFIIHHELAHAGLGHEGLRYLRSAAILESDDSPDSGGNFMDEFAGVSGAASDAGGRLTSQALETDADVHGMLYTRQFLRDEAEMLLQRSVASDEVMGTVWGALLRDTHCEQLMLFIGIAVGLLALLPDLEADRIDHTAERTHPPLPSRLLLVFHVAGSISGYRPSFWENRSAAITTAIGLIGAFQREEFGKRTKSRGVSCVRYPGDEIETENDGAPNAIWRPLGHLSIVDAWLRQDELGPYWETLVSRLRTLSALLAPYARCPESLRYTWHRLASKNDGDTITKERPTL